MNDSRRIGGPQRGHGRACWPYTARWRGEDPLLTLTSPDSEAEGGEVPALTVDVDVQRVEGGAARGEALAEHVAHALERVVALPGGQLVGGPGAVQPGPPERLIGVDVADPADQRLVQQRPLHL